MSVEEADAYLRTLPGVGPKTATFAQLFSVRRPVLPVDTHVHRTTQRLGVIGKKVTEASASAATAAPTADAARSVSTAMTCGRGCGSAPGMPSDTG